MDSSEISGKAFVLSNGVLHTVNAKTAHGLIRGSERFEVVAVIDHQHAGKEAGELLDGTSRGIPIYASLREALEREGKPDYCIIGVATVGGVLPPALEVIIREALQNGISIVNGLHDYLQDRPALAQLARENGARLIDIRRPKAIKDLHFWSEEIYEVKCPIIAVLGMDCAVGKRTTARIIREACRAEGIKAEMIYTGQTGWMQGARHGFIFDSTLNDFVSGELSHAIISAYKDENPDLILLEGQSALRNPSGPCGAEYLISGNAKHVVLVHELKRIYYDEEPKWGRIPSVESEIDLIRAYGAEVIALSLNTNQCSKAEIISARTKYEQELGIPVLLPVEEGVKGFIPVVQHLMNRVV